MIGLPVCKSTFRKKIDLGKFLINKGAGARAPRNMMTSDKTTVVKFGGTSLADAEQFRKVGRIVAADFTRRIVVVSAPGKRFPEDTKVTDLLIACYEAAVAGRDFSGAYKAVCQRFRDIIVGLGLDFSLDDELAALGDQLRRAPRRDYVVSRGEYFSARVMAEYLGFTFVDPAWCICFHENGKLDDAMTRRALTAALRPLQRAVVAGFYGADSLGNIHTFSRGGSDVTGSLVACAIDADRYENWTDVSGLMSADPRIVENPRIVDHMSYRELRTLSYMGASVLHSDAVLSASERDIPINIRNTNDPDNPGTLIGRKRPKGQQKHPVIGVAGRKGMSVIQVEKVMVSDGSGFSAIMLDILKKRQLPFEHCLTGIDSITLVIRSDLLAACKAELLSEIRAELAPDYMGIREKLSVIAVVGEKDTETSDANVRVLMALTQAGIEITTINQGAGKLNLLIGVPEEKYEAAIRAIYGTMQTL